MNRLTDELVRGILGEEMAPRKETVGIFAGGFKPPTIGHFSVIQKALEDYPEMDRVIVYVGSGERDSINQKESIAVWRIYQKYLPAKVEIQPSPEGKPPVGKVYSYAKKNPDKNVYMLVGSREGNEGDEKDFAGKVRRLTSKPEEYPNLTAKKIDTGDGISGTRARKTILDKNKEAFFNYIPDIPEKEEIWNILSEIMGITENQNIEPNDQVLARKGAFVYNKGKKLYLKSRRLFVVKGEVEDRITLEDQKGRQFWIMKHEMDNNWAKFDPIQVPLHERIAYDAETRMQTRFLMKQFLKNLGKKVESDTEGVLVGKKYELVYGFYPQKRGLGFMPFKVEGNAGPKDIVITIKYNPELLTKELYSELSAEIRNSVRHELEHVAQYRAEKGVRPGEDGVDQDDLPDAEYLTLDYEIPGHIQGLRTKAKAKKISLQQAIDDLFDSYEYDLTPEEEDFVRETWMNWLETNMPGVSLTKIKEDFDQQDVEDLDNLADRELNPIDVVLTGKHFFDRLNDPRNTPGIDYLELEDFFTKLGDNREEFIDFLNKYKSVVATDTETNINIPFMKMANKAIAKTIMRKRNFQTPDVKVELEEADPKKGTGKKPKGSGRRLYTDENPKDTVRIKFSTRQDIVDTLSKKSFKAKSHARQSQVINLIHQRVRAAYGRAKKPEVKKRLKSALDYITKRKEASKAKTKRLQAQKKKKKTNENVAPNHNQKAAPFGSGYKKVQELVLEIVPKDVIDSFDIQDTLVPEVWDNEKLKPEVREKLLEIAQDFFESLDLPEGTQLKDIKLTGSLANYNWSKFSDFDLHLVLDFSEIDDDEEFVRNYFMAKKGIWNDAHDINIYNFPVEVYVENEGESHTASGLYSILNDEWIVVPKKKEVMIDKDDITTKAEDYISQFEDVQKLYNDGEYEKVIDKVDKIKERLRNMRSSGLEKGGEYSVENLAFKVLRRSDIIGQLNDLKSNSYDTMMSIKEGIGDDLATHIKSLTKYMKDNGLNLRPYPKVRFIDNDVKNAEDILGLTAFYNPNEKLVVLYTLNRHPKDVLRSYAHELVHHHQNLSNTLDHSNTTNTNEDGDLEKIEREAYETGNILFRKWTDEKKDILQNN